MLWLENGQIAAILVVVVVVLISLWIYFRLTLVMCDSKADLSGKTALVTGANRGIGYFTALDFARRNARVIMACRNKVLAEKARDQIIAKTGNKNVVAHVVDLTVMKSIQRLAKRILEEEPQLNILVNNAGVVSTGKPKEITEEGFETIFAVNYFGPFVLTNLLLDLLKKSQPSRIVNVSSLVNKYGTIDFDNLQAEKSFKYHERYFDSKLGIILFTRLLAKKLENTGVTANVLHPGTIDTDLLRDIHPVIRVPVQFFIRVFCKSAEEGAQTSIYLSVSDEVNDISGKYFVDCDIQEKEANPFSRKMDVAEKLWEVSEKLTSDYMHV